MGDGEAPLFGLVSNCFRKQGDQHFPGLPRTFPKRTGREPGRGKESRAPSRVSSASLLVDPMMLDGADRLVGGDGRTNRSTPVRPEKFGHPPTSPRHCSAPPQGDCTP